MGLKVWLPLLGNLNNQGCSNIEITNVGATVNASGKIGSCYTFNRSSNNYLRLSPILTNTDEFSIAFWVNFAAINQNQCCYSQRIVANATGFTIFYINGSGIRFDDGTSLQSTQTFTTNTWHHVVCCRDSIKKYIYIDGILSISTNKSNTAASAVNSNYSLIGGSQNNTAGSTPNDNFLNGNLNDYRIYDHCLSAAEIREISQGLVLHYKLDNMSSTTVEDSSGYNHNGTRAGTISAYTDSPRYSQCMNLSATSSRINCGRGGMVTDAITVNFWANLPTVPSALSDTTGFVSCAESGGFRIQVGNNGVLRSIVYINSAYAVIEGTTVLQANTWYMITLVYDRINSKLYEYINGIKDAELDIANNKIIGYNSGNVLWIGVEARSNTSYYSAIAEKVSDFRIYCTALDADAIRQLYEVGAKVDNKQNLHAFELNEMSEDTNSNVSLSFSTTSSNTSITSYTTTKTPAPATQTISVTSPIATRTTQHLSINYNKKYILKETSNALATTRTYNYTSYRWQSSGGSNSYTQTKINTVNGYFCRYRLLVKFYDANDTLLKTIALTNSTYSASNTSNTQYSSSSHTFPKISPTEITINPTDPNEANATYIVIAQEITGASQNFSSLTLSSGTSKKLKVKKTGTIEAFNFQEASAAKFYTSNSVSADEFIEI